MHPAGICPLAVHRHADPAHVHSCAGAGARQVPHRIPVCEKPQLGEQPRSELTDRNRRDAAISVFHFIPMDSIFPQETTFTGDVSTLRIL